MAKLFSLWVGNNFNSICRLTMASTLKWNHTLTLFSYEENINLPGVQVIDANSIIKHNKIYKVRNSYASFSNEFRYTVLKYFPAFGTRIDMDMVILKSFAINENDFCFGFEDKYTVNNAILKYPSNSHLADFLLFNSQTKGENKWGETGPKILTNGISQFDLHKHALNRSVFYPIGPWELPLLLFPGLSSIAKKRVKDASGIHLWNELLVRFGFKANFKPPKNSFLEYLYVENGIDVDDLIESSPSFLYIWSLRFLLGFAKHLIHSIFKKMKIVN